MKLPHVVVTDHALIRYLERVRGIDLEIVRREVAGIVGPAIGIGGSKFYDGKFTYVLEGPRVVTIAPGRTGANHSKHRRPEGRR